MTRKQNSMFPTSFTVLFIAFLFVFVDGVRGGEQAGNINPSGKANISHSASENLKSISIPFIENKGQVDDRVAYYAPINAGTVYVTRKGELVYKLHGAAEKQTNGEKPAPANHPRGWVLTETLVGATPEPRGVRQTPTRVSSFQGSDTKQWRKELRTYGEILLGDVYPNVSVSLTVHDATVEKIFTVRPGGSLDSIRLHLSGQKDLEIVPDGALMAKTGLGSVLFSRPIAWQNKGKQRIEVDVQWHIADNGEYGYQVAQYDPAITLYIDPVIQATYLGGSGDELESEIIGIDAGGDILVGGSTSSVDFPGTTGGVQSEFGGLAAIFGDIYIARLSSDLTTLVQVTYLGGSGDDFLMGSSALSAAGTEFYIFGATGSTDFPGTAGAAQSMFGGSIGDGFVAMLSTDLKTLHQATYYGGNGNDSVSALSFGPNNQLYFTGSTASTDLPGTAGGAQATYGGGGVDIFVVLLSSDLTTLNQATYFGGSGDERTGPPPDPGGDSNGFYLVGSTDSTDLPGTAGGLQPVFAGTDISGPSGGAGDGFIALLSDDLTSITQATYLGGSKFDSTFSMSDADSGSKFIVGFTTSEDMPGTTGGAQPVYGGGGFPSGDGYIALVGSDLRTLIQATYLGGSGNDSTDLTGKLNGSIYFSGDTGSADFPGTAGGAQPDYSGFGDVYVARLSSDLKTLQQSTYYGGSGDDDGHAYLRSNGEIYLGGGTSSTDLPGTAGGVQPVFAGGNGQFALGDVFIARLSPDLTTLHQATYYGGNGDDDDGVHFYFDLNGNFPEADIGFYLAGGTNSTNLPGVAGGAQETFAGGSLLGTDMYIVLMSLDLLAGGGGGGTPASKSADLVIDFGVIGLWARMNDASWQKLNNSSPDQVVVGDVDGNGVDDVIADFSSTFGGIFIKRNGGGWSKLHNFSPELMMIGDLDNNGQDDVVIDFGGIGLWARMNDSNWLKLNNASPVQLVVGDVDGNGADDVVAVFSSGIFVKHNLAGWSQLHNFIPEVMAVGDLDGNGKDDIVIDFGGIALWVWMNDSSWSKLHNNSPDLIATGDLDGNGSDDVIATFSGSGLWQKLNLGGWSQLNQNTPDKVFTADVDGSGQDDIIAKFGSTIGGIFVKRNQGSWSKLHNSNPDSIAAGNLDEQ